MTQNCIVASELPSGDFEVDNKILTLDELHKLTLLMPDSQLILFRDYSYKGQQVLPWKSMQKIDFNDAR